MLDFIISYPLLIVVLVFSFLFAVFYKRLFILFIFLFCFFWLFLKVSFNIEVFHLNSFFYNPYILLFLFVFIFSVNITFIVNYCLPEMGLSRSFSSRSIYFSSLLKGEEIYTNLFVDLQRRFIGSIFLSFLEILGFWTYVFSFYLKVLFLYLRAFYLGFFFIICFLLFDSFLIASFISILYIVILTYVYNLGFNINKFNIADRRDIVFSNIDSMANIISINLFEFAYSRFLFLKNLNERLWFKTFETQNGLKNTLFNYYIPVFKYSYTFYNFPLKMASKFKTLITFFTNLVEYYLNMFEFFGLNETTEGIITHKLSYFNVISSYLSNLYPNLFIGKNFKSSDFDYDIEQSDKYLIDFVDYSFFDNKNLTGSFNDGLFAEFSMFDNNIFEDDVHYPYFEDITENVNYNQYNLHTYLDRFMSKYFGILFFLNFYYLYVLDPSLVFLRFYFLESYIKTFGIQISSWFGPGSYIGDFFLIITGGRRYSDFTYFVDGPENYPAVKQLIYTTDFYLQNQFYVDNLRNNDYSKEESEKIQEVIKERYSKMEKI